MYTIGEISKLVQISSDALRHYDEIGLLKPDQIDPQTRYRYYSLGQINQLVSIMEWKKCRFSLDAIAGLINSKDTAELKDICLSKINQLRLERDAIDQSISLLQSKVNEYSGDFPFAKRSALVIDDSSFMRNILKELLEKQGFLVKTAADGESGSSMYAADRPDLVILDIGMPGIDGFETFRRIKGLDQEASILICSARGKLQDILHFLSEGALGYIIKPFTSDRLFELLKSNHNPRYSSLSVNLFLHDDRVPSYTHKIPQEIIDRLFSLCCHEVTDQEAASFWEALAQERDI